MISRWTLTRRSNQNVVHIFIQEPRPTDEYISAFGRPEEFDLTQSPMTQDEIDAEREDRRARYYPDLRDLMLAVYFKEKGNNQPMTRLVNLIDAIRQANQ